MIVTFGVADAPHVAVVEMREERAREVLDALGFAADAETYRSEDLFGEIPVREFLDRVQWGILARPSAGVDAQLRRLRVMAETVCASVDGEVSLAWSADATEWTASLPSGAAAVPLVAGAFATETMPTVYCRECGKFQPCEIDSADRFWCRLCGCAVQCDECGEHLTAEHGHDDEQQGAKPAAGWR